MKANKKAVVGIVMGSDSDWDVLKETVKVLKRKGAKLEIFATSTSCGCTSAELEKNMLQPGESATLTVSFIPNFHREPEGKFDRTIYLKTNDPANREKEIKIFVELTK